MPRHTLYCYVAGKDVRPLASLVFGKVETFIRETQWRCQPPWPVDQFGDASPGVEPQCELGLNYDLPDAGSEPAGWFQDVEQIVLFFAKLHSATGRTFALGISDNQAGANEDLFYIDGPAPALTKLRQIIGVADNG